MGRVISGCQAAQLAVQQPILSGKGENGNRETIKSPSQSPGRVMSFHPLPFYTSFCLVIIAIHLVIIFNNNGVFGILHLDYSGVKTNNYHFIRAF